MKRFERATSYPYGHLLIDLKSDTPEKDRLHTEIFDTAKTMDEKMTVEKGSVGTKYEEEEEERGGGIFRKRMRRARRKKRRRMRSRKRWRRGKCQ